jgi:hypothetical protein
MAYEDIITVGGIDYTIGYNGELINLDDLSDEEFAELMGEDDIFDDEEKGKSAGGSFQSSFKMDNEYISYMAFMETEKERLENYS